MKRLAMMSIVCSFISLACTQGEDSSLKSNNGPYARSVGESDRAGFMCTASFIDRGDGELAAYFLTAGHCISATGPDGEVISDSVALGHRINLSGLESASELTVNVQKTVYSTMAGVDIALLEVDRSQGELMELGYVPLELSLSEASIGLDIEVYHKPVASESFLYSECSIEAEASLLEGLWHFDRVFRNRCENIAKGSSGSPVIADGLIVGVMGTLAANDDDANCSSDRPCEIIEGGVANAVGAAYFAPVAELAACIKAGVFTLDEACELPRHYEGRIQGLSSQESALEVSLQMPEELNYYKLVPLSPALCDEATSYNALASSSVNIDFSAFSHGERALLCTAKTELPASPRLNAIYIDREAPTEGKAIAMINCNIKTLHVWANKDVTHYGVKLIEGKSGSCSDLEGYSSNRGDWYFTPGVHSKACVLGGDYAGNWQDISLALELPINCKSSK